MARPKNCGRCNKPKRPRGNHFKDLPGYCKCGHPTKMDQNTLNKLEDAFTYAFNDEQACAYAGISPKTLYNYQEKNPEYVQRKQQLKMRPDMKAKRTIVDALGNIGDAWKWAERTDPTLKQVTKIEHSGYIESAVDLIAEMSDEEKDAYIILRNARQKRIQDNIKSKE